MDNPSATMVPFDVFSVDTSVFVIDRTTNESVPIISCTAIGVVDDFLISSNNIPAKTDFAYYNGTKPMVVEVDAQMISIKAKRSQLAKAFTLCLFLINWTLTAASIYITLLVVFRREKMDAAVLLLPVTLVLTIPTLRSLYVGSPPFGIFIGKFWVLRP